MVSQAEGGGHAKTQRREQWRLMKAKGCSSFSRLFVSGFPEALTLGIFSSLRLQSGGGQA